jgi:hypothetical protein
MLIQQGRSRRAAHYATTRRTPAQLPPCRTVGGCQPGWRACIDGTASRNVCEGAQSAPIGSQLRGNLILIMLASDERF